MKEKVIRLAGLSMLADGVMPARIARFEEEAHKKGLSAANLIEADGHFFELEESGHAAPGEQLAVYNRLLEQLITAV